MNPENFWPIIEKVQEKGADFCEIYLEETREDNYFLQDQKIEEASTAIDFGIGIRLFLGTQAYYTYSNKLDKEYLLKLVKELLSSFPVKSPTKTYIKPNLAFAVEPKKENPYSLREVIEFLQRADVKARSLSSKVAQVGVSLREVKKNILILNSEGLCQNQERKYLRYMVSVTAEDKGERFMATEAPGFSGEVNLFSVINPENLAEVTANRALLMLHAGYISGGVMPVVLGNGFGGVIFHEACGHLLETEAIRKKASPFVGKVGEKIAHEKLTAIDTGDIPQAYGSLTYDDEGHPTQKTILIENGVLKNYLSDRLGALETNSPLTGSGRRESYRYPPVARMRNTYIAAGEDQFEDMIQSIDFGLYAKKMGGGSVNPATGEFNFAVEEGYVIRKGKIAEPVRGCTLIGRGEEILPKISMIGKDLEISAGTCGASSGLIPVTVGQPTLKVDAILVGGR